MRTILYGQMRPTQIYLKPEGSGGGGGGNSQQNDDANADDIDLGEEFDIDQTLGLDPDILDDESKEKYEKGKKRLQELQKRLKAAEGNTKLLEQVQQELQELKRSQAGNKPRGRTDEEIEKTFEEEMYDHYVNKCGMKPEQARIACEINAPLFELYGTRVVGHVNNTVGPVANRVVAAELKTSFQDVQDNDWRLGVPEIAEKTWQEAQKMVKNGVSMTPDIISSITKIEYVNFMDANPDFDFEPYKSGGDDSVPPPRRSQQQQQQRKTNGNMNSRHTYPGAGHLVTTPRRTNASTDDGLNEDTRSALDKINHGWLVYRDPAKVKLEAEKAARMANR